MAYNRSKLLEIIKEQYNLDELKELFFLVDVPYDSVRGGEVVDSKALELIKYMQRRKRLSELVEAIAEQRPDIDLRPAGGPAPSNSLTPRQTTSTQAQQATSNQIAYVNFDLRIQDRREEGYPVEGSHSYSGGAGTPSIVQNFNLGDSEFQDLLTYLQELVGEGDDAKQFGTKLRQLLFPRQVWTLFNTLRESARSEGKGVRIRLRIDPPELSRLPWEYCYDEENGLFFAKDLKTPLVRYIQRPFTPDSLTTASPLKILLVVAAPTNALPLDAAEEERRLQAILQPLGEKVNLEVLKENVTPYQLQRCVSQFQPHVLHFVGHGEFRDGEGALLLEDEQKLAQRLNAEQLADLLRHRGVKLVVLNACQTAATDEGDAFMGVAPALVRADIPAVIAMQFAVPDQMAIRYTQALYDYLTLGEPLDTAVTEMRISASNGPAPEDQVFWGIPVLFMRSPDGVLWQAPQSGHGASSTATPTVQTFSGVTTFIAGDQINDQINVAGDFVSDDKHVSITQVSSTAAPRSNLDILLDEIATLAKQKSQELDEFDADDLNDAVDDAQKSLQRQRADRAVKKLEDALEIAENNQLTVLQVKLTDALRLARQQAGS